METGPEPSLYLNAVIKEFYLMHNKKTSQLRTGASVAFCPTRLDHIKLTPEIPWYIMADITHVKPSLPQNNLYTGWMK